MISMQSVSNAGQTTRTHATQSRIQKLLAYLSKTAKKAMDRRKARAIEQAIRAQHQKYHPQFGYTERYIERYTEPLDALRR